MRTMVSKPRTTALRAAIVLAAFGGSACAARPPHATAPSFEADRPVPASETQASIRLALTLPSSANCEERFDLALYNHPGVVLIEWQDSPSKCTARLATVHYLPRRISALELLSLASRHATRVSRADAPAVSSQVP